MRTCDFCSHHKMTVLNSDGSTICASCSDAEYVTNLLNAVEIYQARNAELVEALESAQRSIADMEFEKRMLRPVGVMSESRFRALENGESRFIALWPRPGIYLPRKRPDDGVMVYARIYAAGISIKGE
ncbi:hypothetical protein ABNU38_13915 [Citrobacter braakii]|uniref:hypothetical protein n=1 Tax=Citrobacter braakii TaxID=57706 RepID=UPI00339C2E4D